ncbi:hypothetical protein LBWT_X0120 (plasmid) [Leptolyngbya boryana IAM M-101]|nr:hypothetical protein LBWT_X0120 [Leptolyngbya boryana IAM M-101]BAS66288.1 hypothetical protein LBDG_X0120 [Leptolyngbya boryana dg5]
MIRYGDHSKCSRFALPEAQIEANALVVPCRSHDQERIQ